MQEVLTSAGSNHSMLVEIVKHRLTGRRQRARRHPMRQQ